MTYDEGLRSYKAIAFIESLALRYVKLGATPQQIVLSNKTTLRQFSKNLGGKNYG
ncbi:MAG: hypothetical protein NWE98_04655 [Candidatus Bathyarchaeota archaeon]|nr:hypothetical protein [Candidatus Bathyarchaeota archaeon]